MRSLRAPILAMLWALTASPGQADSGPVLDDKAIGDIVDRLSGALQDEYPLPGISGSYQGMLTKERRGGAYRGLTACDLASRLSADLQKTHRDRHLNLWCGDASGSAPDHDRLGHGLQSVALYPDLSLAAIAMPGPWELDDESFEAVTHALGLAADADNVVIDLRGNPGGHGEIGHFIASYFLPPSETRIFERALFRPPRPPEIVHTLPYVPGRRLTDSRLFILINAETGSAAEGFAFGMQRMRRATLVGQTSAGAGIAGHERDLGHGVRLFLPFKLIVAPDSDMTWEGKGVIPDRVTEPGKEYDAVTAMIREETIKRDAPVVTSAAEPAAATPPPLTDERTPHLEDCQARQISDDGRALSQVNRCGRSVTVQYANGDLPNDIHERILAPGDRMDIALPARHWWIMATCPEGYYSSVPLDTGNREAIENSRYSCIRAPGTNR